MKLFDIFIRLINEIKAYKNWIVFMKQKHPHFKTNTGQFEPEKGGQVDAELHGQVEPELHGQVKWK